MSKVFVNKKTTAKEIHQKVANILFNDFRIGEEDYNKQTNIREGLCLTHYGFQQFLLKIESTYEIELSDQNCETVQDLLDQIQYLIIKNRK